jgi:hypothetical protein
VQRGAARFITGDYRSRTPGSIQKLLKKLDLPTLQDRRKHLRLCFFYKVVEGLVPAISPQNFLVPQKPGRLIRSKRDLGFVSSNIIHTYIRNNDRCYSIKPCKTDQFRNSFVYHTAVEWNALDNSVVNAGSADSFKTLLTKRLATNHQ